jgi:pimeloyl-ACP methyl ester carboxylesterase
MATAEVRESGTGRPIVLLHGNPTSSYLWRSVLPPLEGLGRCIVPDLIGMGDSDKPGSGDPGRYTFAGHREFLHALLEALGVGGDVGLVIHDWGSALGFDWTRRHPGQVRAMRTWKPWSARSPDGTNGLAMPGRPSPVTGRPRRPPPGQDGGPHRLPQ